MSASGDVSPDVDGGLAFVFTAVTWITGIITAGVSFSSSIFYALFLDEFQASPVITAWAVNLNLFCFLATGVFSNCVLLMFGPRKAIIVGCLLSSAGLVSCSFARNIIEILCLYGILTGTGYNFAHLTTYSSIPNYYKKYRIFATAITAIGAGVGQFIIPPIIRFLVDQYHWRGAFLILGAVTLNLLVVAAILMPPRSPGAELDNDQEKDTCPKNENLSKKDKVVNVVKNLCANIFLFRCPHWTLFCFGRLFLQVCIGGFLTHIYNFGRQPFLQLSMHQVTFLPSIVGIGSITGKLVGGVAAQMKQVPVVFVYILMASMFVIAGIVITLGRNYQGIASSCFLAGFGLGSNALLFETIIYIAGIKSHSTGLSYAMLFSGVGFLVGGPIAAWVYEMDQSYFWTFVVIGIAGLLGVLMNIPAWLTISDRKIRERLSKDELIRARDKTVKISENQSNACKT